MSSTAGYIAYRNSKDPKDLNLDTDVTQCFDISKGEGPAIYDAASGDRCF